MPRVVFTANLQRHVRTPPADVTGSTVRDALDAAFKQTPAARSYILDELGALRPHVTVFVDGRTVRDRDRLTDPVQPDSEVYVMQALSGG